MTDIDSMSLGLPDPIEAEPGKIRSGADDLDELHGDMLGQSDDTDAQMRSSADQFTDSIAWDISSASADELMAWEEASKALTYGGGVLRLWAEDIDTYMTERASIETRWETAKQEMQNLRLQGGSGYAIGMAVNDLVGGDTEAAALEQTRLDLRSEHASIWGTLMDQAEQTKVDLRTGPSKETLERMVELGLLTAGQIATYGDSFPGMVPDEIDGSEPPHLVNAWWDSLSEDEREQAMADDPNLLRDLDGIPSDVRDQLNRDHLGDEHEAVQSELEELRDERGDMMVAPGNRAERSRLDTQIEELEAQEATMERLHNRLGETAGDSDQYLLAFDTGDHGRAIVSRGNPDTADNVATLVPGTGATWESVNGQSDRAGVLQESAIDADEDADHAVISWVGYDAPSETEAPAEGRAENAVGELSSFQEGLRATQQGTTPSNNTVIGHSYGSTVLGHTAMSDQGLNAEELVFVGSPGVKAENVSELGFHGENVHATTAENDKINDLTPESVHGPVPGSPEFGATAFPSDSGSEWKWGDFPFGAAHSEYFDDSSTSVEEMGEIIAGGR